VELAKGIEVVGDASYGSVRAFLVKEDDGTLTLVDALAEKQPFMILAAIRRIGCAITDLKRIYLTHAHFSHLAGLVALADMSGAKVFVHEEEADIVCGRRQAERVPLLPKRPYQAYYPLQFGAALGKGSSGIGRNRFEGCAVDECLEDDEVRGRIKIVYAPGHTRGHVAFWIEDCRVLLAGDAIVTWPYEAGGWESFMLDWHEQRESLSRLAKLRPERVGVGHGSPIVANAERRVRRLAAQLPRI
jgi:glyoxylase-like metal-dependent hydrolase (beta-lactamase superfamily II)